MVRLALQRHTMPIKSVKLSLGFPTFVALVFTERGTCDAVGIAASNVAYIGLLSGCDLRFQMHSVIFQ